MIKLNRTIFIISTALLTALTGCGLKNYFPDKEKDYQLRHEIAPLNIPNDLSNQAFKRQLITPDKDETEKVKVIRELVDSNEVEADTSSEKITEDTIEYVEITDKTEQVNFINKVTSVELVMFDGGATRLRINENFAPAWRLVAKALSRNLIEITSRDKAAGQLIVQYDPNKTDFIDDSIKDEFLFFFGEKDSQEKELRIRLIAHNKTIEVIILNDEDQPLSEGAGLKLLKLLFSTIHTELTAHK